MRGRDRHVVGHYRLGQPFQRKRADFFERYGLLDRDRYSLCDEDLSILGLRAKARGEIAHSADRGIAGAFRKADLAEDAYAALRYLSQLNVVDPARVAVLGESMGGSSVLDVVDRGLAAQHSDP